MRKRQLRHGQTVMGGTQVPGLVPGLPGGHNAELIELQICNSRLHQRHMCGVGWVKCAPEYTNSLRHRLRGTHAHFTPIPCAPETGCTNQLLDCLLQARFDKTSSPAEAWTCLLYTSPSPRDGLLS